MIKRGKHPPRPFFEKDQMLSLEDINKEVEDMGYRLEYYGRDLTTLFLLVEVLPIKPSFGAPDDPFIRVYAIGDYTLKEWRRLLWSKLGEVRRDGIDLRYRTKNRIERRQKWHKKKAGRKLKRDGKEK